MTSLSMRAPTPSLNGCGERELWGWQPKKLPGGDEMRYVVSLIVSIVVWKLVVGPAVYEAVKALETASRVLGG
jgi:hypothetical protein